MLLVGQERKRQAVLQGKLGMRGQIVGTDSEYHGTLRGNPVVGVTEIASLLCAGGGHIFRVKIKQHLAAAILA